MNDNNSYTFFTLKIKVNLTISLIILQYKIENNKGPYILM